jgi:hypothetical protein
VRHQERRQLANRPRPLAGVPGGRPGKERVDAPANVRALAKLRAESTRVEDTPPLAAVRLEKRRGGRLPFQIGFPRERVKERATQAENVRMRPNEGRGVREQLLGRGVSGRAEHDVPVGRLEPLRSGEAEIADLEDLGGSEAAAEHVVRLDVPVHDADGMDRLEAFGEREEEPDRSLRFESVTRFAREP